MPKKHQHQLNHTEHECLECGEPFVSLTDAEEAVKRTRYHALRYHTFCWLLRLALIAPAIHLVLHALAFFGVSIPHPESIALIP